LSTYRDSVLYVYPTSNPSFLLSTTAETVDHTYVRELFDEYAPIYDKHMKKLMYSATRVIRQELATVYRSQFGIYDGRYSSDGSISGLEPVAAMEEVEGVVRPISDKAFAAGVRTQKMSDVSDFKEAQGPVGAGCSSYSSFMNKSLDILDIGCGTGGAGAWLKDYANTLVGVDLSENMVQLARKKMLYQELHVQPLNTYLLSCTKTFDLVVAADVLSYVGDLRETFQQVRHW
jgi:2-polyprenyl-3-methyl-5-hydroxy-6-metoxy-1,4-benzoquinol methylase